MASGVLGVALTGLNAAQAGIRTTQHNIANVNTAGYRRQEVNFAAIQPDQTAAGYFGNGTSVENVRSLYSRFLDNEVALNQSRLARHETFAAQSTQIDKLLGNAGTGLSTALDGFFSAVNELANDPASNAARQILLSAGNALAFRVNALDGNLRAQVQASNGEIDAAVQRVNGLAGQVAQLNASISRAEALNGRTANDLRDQRDQIVGELGKLVDVTRLEQGDGMLSVFIGSGQPLIMGTVANALSTSLDADGLRQIALNMGGTVVSIGSGLLSGGSLGGLLAVREQVILPAMSDLNRIAVAIGAEVNRVHRLGEDINQLAGGAFFNDAVVGAGGNAGVLNFVLGNDLLLPRDNFTLGFDGTNYTLTRLSDNNVTVGNLAAVNAVTAPQGFTLNVATAPGLGDTWTINLKDYARGMSLQISDTARIAAAAAGAAGPGDNRNALDLAALQTALSLNNGTTTFSGAYNQTLMRTATLAAQADLDRSALTALVSSAKASQQAVSGVNLDEEAVNLIRFQQAYQASARAMQIAASLFDEVLGIVR